MLIQFDMSSGEQDETRYHYPDSMVLQSFNENQAYVMPSLRLLSIDEAEHAQRTFDSPVHRVFR